MTAMPAAFDSAVDVKSTSWPWKRNTPPSRRCTPATILTSVDLPAPFSPINAWIEPASTVRAAGPQCDHGAEGLGHVPELEDRTGLVGLSHC